MKKLLLLLLLSILIYSCKETNIDYSDKNNWLQISEDKNNEVDVFYLYHSKYFYVFRGNPILFDTSKKSSTFLKIFHFFAV